MIRLALFLTFLAVPALAQKGPPVLIGTAYPITGTTMRIVLEKGAVREIRLWGVAVPNTRAEQLAARDKLDSLVGGKRISCDERWTDGLQVDALCTVEETDVGLNLVSAGLAFMERRDLAGKPEWPVYAEAESVARAAKNGVWGANGEAPPSPATPAIVPVTSETEPLPTPQSGPAESESWLYRWQNLIAGTLAFFGGLIAYVAARRYSREQRTAAGRRRR